MWGFLNNSPQAFRKLLYLDPPKTGLPSNEDVLQMWRHLPHHGGPVLDPDLLNLKAEDDPSGLVLPCCPSYHEIE